MRQITRKSLMTMAAATGVIAAAGGYAQADSGAVGSATNSPGVLSGNSVQAPVHVPVNVCGNTVNVVGVLNPAMGNSCVNAGASGGHGGSGGSGAHGGSGGAQAGGHTGGSPGVGSGNHVEAPIDVPVNVCGNSVDAVGVGNAAYGNDCGNGGGHHGTPPGGGDGGGTPGGPGQPGGSGGNGGSGGDGGSGGSGGDGGSGGSGGSGSQGPGGSSGAGHLTPVGSSTPAQQGAVGQLAHTGGDLEYILPAGAAALLAGTVLYRRARRSA